MLNKSKTYDFDLFAVLSFGDLRCTLFIKVGALDLVLKFTELGGLGADLLNLSILLLLVHLHAGHLPSKVFLHQGYGYLTVRCYQARSISDAEVGRCRSLPENWVASLSESHGYTLTVYLKLIYSFLRFNFI